LGSGVAASDSIALVTAGAAGVRPACKRRETVLALFQHRSPGMVRWR
jgi:hypothetical protein